MTDDLTIRTASVDDAATLTKVAWLSFHQAFADNPHNRPEDIKLYMDTAFSLETISEELGDKDTTYYVAEIGDEMVGYAKIKRNSTEDCVAADNPVELSRLYSLKDRIGKGIGSALIKHSMDMARRGGHDVMWLGVWEYNHLAQKFYTRHGFTKVGEHIFLLGTDPQTDWIMQQNL